MKPKYFNFSITKIPPLINAIRLILKDKNHIQKIFDQLENLNYLTNKTIVFNSIRQYKEVFDRESFLGKIFAIYGAKVIILIDDGVLKHWDTLQINDINNIKSINKINLNPYPRLDLNLKKRINNFFFKFLIKVSLSTYQDENLRFINYSQIASNYNLQIDNLDDLEKYAEASTIRFFKSELDFKDDNIKYYYNLSLMNAILSRNIGKYIYDKLKPDIFITSHGIYSTWGPAFDFLKEKGIYSLIFIDKHVHSEDFRDIYFSDTIAQKLTESKFWKSFKKANVTEHMEKMVRDYFSKRFNYDVFDTKIYYSKGTNTFTIDKNDGYQYHVAMFPNIIWDGNVKDRHTVFDNLTDWIISTIDYVEKRTEIKLIIKSHPAEASLYRTSTKTEDIIKKNFDIKEFKNVTLIPPERNINTYQFLKSGVDLGICYDGFLAIEMPFLKIPTIICTDSGRFSVEDGNFTVKDKNQYFYYLDNIDYIIKKFHSNYKEYYNNIIRYAYWYLYENVMKLPSLSNQGLYGTRLSQIGKKDLILDKKLIKILNN